MLRLKLQRRVAAFALDIDLECGYPVTAVFGPSGAGKTSLLNTIAGLVRPDAGEISIDGQTLFSTDQRINLAPEKRGIGYVFQQDLLFPHLSVEGNLRYGRDLLPAAAHRFGEMPFVAQAVFVAPTQADCCRHFDEVDRRRGGLRLGGAG